MIAPPAGVRVYLSARPCDMRKGLNGLAAEVQNTLKADPFGGSLYVFRGKRGDMLKILAWDGSGLCLFVKRLEQGRFLWPPIVGWSVAADSGPAVAVARGDRLAPDGRSAGDQGARGRIKPQQLQQLSIDQAGDLL